MIHMTHTFTKNDLILFIYKEMSENEATALTEALENDWELYEEYSKLREAHATLPKVRFAPSESSVQQILRYSEKPSYEPHL